MKKIKTKASGFTLIELLVVISIIALLSSIVLATLQTAREKAKASAFRQEVMQLVNALELYKNTNGNYPLGFREYRYEGAPNGAVRDNDGSYPDQTTTLLFSEIKNYIPKIPIPISGGDYSFVYQVNKDYPVKCVGDKVNPPYVITILSSEKGFEDWPYLEGFTDVKCFSLK